MAKGSAMGGPSGSDRPASAGLEVGWDSVPWGWTAQSRAVPRKAARARSPGHGGREVAFLTGAGLRRTPHFLRTAGRPALRPPRSRLPGEFEAVPEKSVKRQTRAKYVLASDPPVPRPRRCGPTVRSAEGTWGAVLSQRPGACPPGRGDTSQLPGHVSPARGVGTVVQDAGRVPDPRMTHFPARLLGSAISRG